MANNPVRADDFVVIDIVGDPTHGEQMKRLAAVTMVAASDFKLIPCHYVEVGTLASSAFKCGCIFALIGEIMNDLDTYGIEAKEEIGLIWTIFRRIDGEIHEIDEMVAEVGLETIIGTGEEEGKTGYNITISSDNPILGGVVQEGGRIDYGGGSTLETTETGYRAPPTLH